MKRNCVEPLRAMLGDKLHERVLEDGRHHVWCYVVLWRFEYVHRDFGFACEMVWGQLEARFPETARKYL